MNQVSKLAGQLLTGLSDFIERLDMTQWGIVSVIFVIVGFMALRSKL
ncbi:MAG: hypothetical protein KF752_09995 [Pirellulaceae bacterium]|nr:hypothetical protein [Pirellulaceae bacterium]